MARGVVTAQKALRDFQRSSEIFRIGFLVRNGKKSAEKC